jgi:hypothetical protein
MEEASPNKPGLATRMGSNFTDAKHRTTSNISTEFEADVG